MSDWILYILQCKGGALYTGITTDLSARIKRHREGRASKYTRSKRPVKLVYNKHVGSESAARREEARIKGLSRREKLSIVG